MAEIIKLDKVLSNQIAAWEVVERPVSVIKELIENSIDANSKNIKVSITDWWIKEISIDDDWDGIEKKYLDLAVEKYSTSKIKNIKDLHNIMTFWFRWEAIASISSVSDMTIETKNKIDDFWSSIKVIWWEKQKIITCPRDKWTKIIIENLFYNTPARLNYLKKPRTEYNHILNYLYQIALIYPEIWFEFISDWKQVFKYKENEDKITRIYNIYSSDISDNILEIDFWMQWISIKWYISDPKVNYSNKNRQNLYVNKRPINSYLISKSINDAYNRYIPHWTHPAYILDIEVDPTQIDVNVHPRKLEIRFANEQSIFRAVYHSISQKLESVSLVSNQIKEQNDINSDFLWKMSTHSSTISNNTNSFEQKKEYYTWSGTKFKSYSPYKNIESNPNQINIWNNLSFGLNKEEGNDYWTINNEQNSNDLHYTKMWKIIWQAHNSYIIVETNFWIKFLDQHALAERIIYEKLVKEDKKVSTQWLLIAESINIRPNEANILKDNIDTFYEMWFDLELLPWNNVIINWIPDFIKKENLNNIFTWILDDIWEHSFNKSKTLDEVKNKIFAYTACRSAIKFWNKLNLFEMNKLLNDAVEDYSATCPHWRPVVFDIDLEELKNKYER